MLTSSQGAPDFWTNRSCQITPFTMNLTSVSNHTASPVAQRCSVNNSRGCDLLNAADDRALIFLSDGSPTHHSFSYNTVEALDIALARRGDSIRVEFSKTNAEFKRLYAAKKRASWHEICSKIDARTNNSKLWSIAKSPSRDRPQVEVCNTTLTADGFPPNDDRATANILGSHYQKMDRLTFNKADKNTERQAKSAVHKCRSSDLGDPVFLGDFSMHELLLVLNALNPKRSPGPDNIHGVMITHLGPSGTQCLLDILNQSWKSVRLPHEWKRAIITPIRKPGKVLSSPESYRPVALTSIPCKIMDRMMLRRLAYFLDSNNLLPREQYGFRRGNIYH
ncbi:putative RNA-directed DNA polymerase from transposon BS [Trichonephila clavipes]|nr:putative RNA-directed DNA polymerase from transposon BS [Trichonephila clavipes]